MLTSAFAPSNCAAGHAFSVMKGRAVVQTHCPVLLQPKASSASRASSMARMAKKFDKKYDDAFDDFRTSGRCAFSPP